jgi:hypothetical protein
MMGAAGGQRWRHPHHGSPDRRRNRRKTAGSSIDCRAAFATALDVTVADPKPEVFRPADAATAEILTAAAARS